MFFENSVKGNNHFLLYLLTIVGCIIGYSIGQFPYGLTVAYHIEQGKGEKSINFESFAQNPDFATIGLDRNLGFVLLLLMFVMALLVLYFCVTVIHRKVFKTLITPNRDIDFSKIIFGFILWMGLAIIAEGIVYMLNPGNYEFNFNWRSFLPLILICVTLLPLQTLFEEVFFRGYLMQGMSIIFKNKWMPLVVTSLLFGLIHITNPEIKAFGVFQMEVYYITAALFLGLITILDDSLELAIGVHTATNFYGATLVSYNGSVIQTDSLMKTTTVEPTTMTYILVVSIVIFIAICYKKYNWKDTQTLFKPISFENNTT